MGCDILENGAPCRIMERYPHFLREDNKVWTRALEHCIPPHTTVWYDVHVGKPVKVFEGSEAFLQRVADGVTRKRIDAVILMHGIWWVIEVKPRGNMTALGQAISYRRLFKEEYPKCDPVNSMVVCDQVDEDLEPIFADLNISVVQTGFQGE